MVEMDGPIKQSQETLQQLLFFKILLGHKPCFNALPGTSHWDVLGKKKKTQIQQVLYVLLELTRTGWSWFTLPADRGVWTLITIES